MADFYDKLFEREGISVIESPRAPYPRNGYYQSDFLVSYDEMETEVCILANQPIHASEDGRRFELLPDDVKELMGYSRLKINEIRFLDVREHRSKLAKAVYDELERLKKY
ncbi:MAG: hypothetical protein AABX30_00760 [Nanoarchaeota archaeon]